MPELESYIQLWATFLILMIVLIWIYKLALYWVDKFISLEKENKRLEREATDRKDIEFIKTIKGISDSISEWDDRHDEAHHKIWGIIEKGHNNILDKLDIVHNKVSSLITK